MITRKEIIFSMGTSNMSYRALKIELCKYMDVCMVEVQDMIKYGVNGVLEPLVAWVLGLKKHIPKGFVPELRIVEVKFKQLVFDKMFKKRKFNGKKLTRGKTWEEEDLELLKIMREQNFPTEVIARALNRSVSAVHTIVTRKL